MRNYFSEEEFVKSFAKDAKQGIIGDGQFEAVVNGFKVVVSNMDNNNSSKVTIYKGSVDGVEFSGSITALKKKLNVEYKKEYNRSAEAGTKVTIKTDEELERTAETATERYRKALAVVLDYSKRYFCSYPADMENVDTLVVRDESVPTLDETRIKDIILAVLKQQRDEEQQRRENEAKKKAEETAAKIEAEKAKLEKQLAELQAKLAKMQ